MTKTEFLKDQIKTKLESIIEDVDLIRELSSEDYDHRDGTELVLEELQALQENIRLFQDGYKGSELYDLWLDYKGDSEALQEAARSTSTPVVQ